MPNLNNTPISKWVQRGTGRMSDLLMSSLPVLSEAELRAIFRDDERAIWRYHILSALLHDHRSVGDVAREFAATTETVRSLRTAFLASGALDELRSKRRGAAGHLGRQSPLAQAVARELATDPQANSNAIWRRVAAQLEGSGIAVPRRTTYRLIERLRPQTVGRVAEPATDTLWPPALVPALRAALSLLPMEPPFDLGRSDLAAQLLPNESDVLERGRRLKDLLEQALADIGPGSRDDPHEVRFRPHQILVGEVLHGRSRDELQDRLAIAPATYTRAKRQGLERIAELLVYRRREQQRAAIRALPPVVPPLFGRDRELQYYEQRLTTEGIAVIWGLPGSGKTVLAGTLAAQQRQAGAEVVWHRCGGSGDAIVRTLLQSYGEDPHTVNQPLPPLLTTLRAALKRGGLLVLEHYERIASDPVTDVLLATIRAGLDPGHMRLIVCSRVLPVWARDNGWLPLGGLPDDLVRPLWSSFNGATVAQHVWPDILSRTLGYPRLLQMLAADPNAQLSSTIFEQVCEGLSESARVALSALLLAGKPWPSEAHDPSLLASTDGLTIPPQQELWLHGLITFQPDRNLYFLHPLLLTHRDGIIATLREQAAIYKRLVGYAIAGEQWVAAATYAVEAGEYQQALAMLEAHADALIAGRAGDDVTRLLRHITVRISPGSDLASAQGLLGTLLLTLGREREAVAAFSTALDLARLYSNQLSANFVQRWERLVAEAYLRLGAWSQALAHTQASMGSERAIGVDVPPEERIALTLLQQRLWLMAGQVSQARRWLADAQMQLQIEPCPQARTLVLLAEGLEALHSGAWSVAIPRLQLALEALPHDKLFTERFNTIATLSRCLTACGEWEQARLWLREGLQQALALGHAAGIVELALAQADLALATDALDEAAAALAIAMPFHDEANRRLSAEMLLIRGRMALQNGELAESLHAFNNVIALVSDPPIEELVVSANVYLALLTLQHGDATTAAQFAQRAARQAEVTGLDRHRALANLCLAQEALLRRALDEAATALDAVAADRDDPLIAGQRQRLYAQLAVARGAFNEAQRASVESAVLLKRSPLLIRQWAMHDVELPLHESV